jgi:DNA-binding SARP family transcriptional activator
MLFMILGPLCIAGSDEVAGTPPMARALALALLIRADNVLTYDHLVRLLWDVPPSSATANLRSYAATLRSALMLGPPTVHGRLSTWRAGHRHAGGYRLSVHPGELDSAVFRDLSVQSHVDLYRGDLDAATERLGQARRLWRGRVGEGLPLARELKAHVKSLNEQLAEVTEQHLALRLYRGETAGVIQEATELARTAPLRERVVEILLRAQAETGNRAGALGSFERYREHLHDAIGADPSRRLRDLYYQIGRGEGDNLARDVLPLR